MSLTILDVIVVVVVLISAILAMVRGFVREVLSIASWVAAAAAAYFLYPTVIPLVEPYVESPSIRVIVAVAAIFFVALIVATYVTMRISDFVIDSRVGAFDRALGFLFGAARGILLLVIALLFFNWLVEERQPGWVANAQSKDMLEDLGDRLVAALPEDVEASIANRLHRGGDELAGEAASSPPGDEETYGSGTRQGLDQLLENSTGAN